MPFSVQWDSFLYSLQDGVVKWVNGDEMTYIKLSDGAPLENNQMFSHLTDAYIKCKPGSNNCSSEGCEFEKSIDQRALLGTESPKVVPLTLRGIRKLQEQNYSDICGAILDMRTLKIQQLVLLPCNTEILAIYISDDKTHKEQKYMRRCL